MLAKHHIVVLLVLASLLAGGAVAHAQYADEPQSESIGDRIGRFGKSLVGTNQRKQTAQRSAPARQQPPRAVNSTPVVPKNVEPDYFSAGGQQRVVQETVAEPAVPATNRGPQGVAQPAGAAAQSGAAPANRATAYGQRKPTVTQRITNRQPVVTEFQNSDAPPVVEMPTTKAPAAAAAVAAKPAARPAPVEIDDEVEAVPARPTREPQYVAQGDVTPKVPPKAETPAAAPHQEKSHQENTTTRRSSPSISVETIGPRKVLIGKQATFKLVLKNTGEMAASDVVVAIAVPEWAEIVDAKSTTGVTEPITAGVENQGLQWKLGTLNSSGREELTLEVVPHKSQPFELAVRWTQAPLASQTTVEVQEPKLAISLEGAKEVSFGERNSYKLTLSNPGTGDAENVSITLMPLNPADGAPASHALGVIRPNEKKTIEIELVARQSGHVTIQAEATAAGDLKATLEEEVLVRRAALDVAIVGTKMQFAGSPASYTIQVKNTGNAPAKNLRVACRLPLQAEHLTSSSSGAYKAETNMVQWTIDSIDPGTDLKLTTKCILRGTGQNKVEVSCAADGDLQQVVVANTSVQAVADLALEVIDPSEPVPVGQDMTYEVRIRNRGSKAADSVDLVAYFANGIEPISVEGGHSEIRSGMVVFKTIPTLEPGKDIVYKIKARADVEGNLRFRAELSCQTLDTKLTQEEATLFYTEAAEAPATAP